MLNMFEECTEAILVGNRTQAEELARRAIAEGVDPLTVIERGFVPGLREAGRRWEEGELFLPELVLAAEAMKAASTILQPALSEHGRNQATRGRVVIGTIEGDIHDIGKTLVATMFSANGYDIRDLGADVPAVRFVAEAESFAANFICISALLTTTMAGQKRVLELLHERALRGRYRVLVGGAPCSAKWAAQIGADGYAGDAISAVQLANSLWG